MWKLRKRLELCHLKPRNARGKEGASLQVLGRMWSCWCFRMMRISYFKPHSLSFVMAALENWCNSHYWSCLAPKANSNCLLYKQLMIGTIETLILRNSSSWLCIEMRSVFLLYSCDSYGYSIDPHFWRLSSTFKIELKSRAWVSTAQPLLFNCITFYIASDPCPKHCSLPTLSLKVLYFPNQ